MGLEFSRLSQQTIPHFANRANVSGEAGIQGNSQDPADWGPPRLLFAGGIASLADGISSLQRNQTTGGSVRTVWNHGRHNLYFGGDYRRQQWNSLGQQDPRGTFTFNGQGGSDFAAFLRGTPDTSSIAYGNADKYFRTSQSDVYMTDDWRIGLGITLNAGVRWEYGSPTTERYGRLVNLALGPGFSTAAPVVTAQVSRPDRSALEPRVGLSWRPRAGSSLVIRTGYGIYYNTSVYQTIAQRMAQQPPLSRTFSAQNGLGNPLTLADGFRGESSTTQNTFAVDPDFRIGYAQNWQISLQRDLPGALVLSTTYLGIQGTRGMQEFLPNTAPIGAPNPCLACPAGFVFLASNGNSTRHAGQLQLRRRLRNGVAAGIGYTWSKSLDNAASVAQNWLDLRAERGLSNFDQRHLFTVQTQYSSFARRGLLLRDWTLTTDLTAGSGLPLNPVFPAAVPGTGFTGSIRPDFTGAPLYSAPNGLSLNPAAFGPPQPGRWGNAAKNSITGPSVFTFNASLGRAFRLSDRFNADLHIDCTNPLNHVTFPSWNTGLNSAQFGLPNSANPMRSVQTTFRVRF